ncbi:MAG: hypothetical protein ACI82Z_001733, partial [Cellvibrionaceae bacterium]
TKKSGTVLQEKPTVKFAFIEKSNSRFNVGRRHSLLNYQSPAGYEKLCA